MAKKERKTAAESQLQQELRSTGLALRAAYEKFNYVSEPELVDACVYEISALKARYDYLLRCIKEQEAPAAVAAANMEGGQVCRS